MDNWPRQSPAADPQTGWGLEHNMSRQDAQRNLAQDARSAQNRVLCRVVHRQKNKREPAQILGWSNDQNRVGFVLLPRVRCPKTTERLYELKLG